MPRTFKIAALAIAASVIAVPATSVFAGNMTIFSDNFNDAVIDSRITTFGDSVTQHNGYLDMQGNSTDNFGRIEIYFNPFNNIKATFRAWYDNGGSNYYDPAIGFTSGISNDHEYFHIQNHLYNFWQQPGLDGVNHSNHPAITNGSVPRTFDAYSNLNSTNLYGQWLDIVMTYDATSGLFDVTFGSNGITLGDLAATIPDGRRLPIDTFYAGTGGWWTGFSTSIDDLVITTNTGTSVPEPDSLTLLSAGFLVMLPASRRRRTSPQPS